MHSLCLAGQLCINPAVDNAVYTPRRRFGFNVPAIATGWQSSYILYTANTVLACGLNDVVRTSPNSQYCFDLHSSNYVSLYTNLHHCLIHQNCRGNWAMVRLKKGFQPKLSLMALDPISSTSLLAHLPNRRFLQLPRENCGRQV